MIRARWFIPLLALASTAWGSASSAEPAAYPLPRDTLPGHLALAGDGSVWMTAEYSGVTRLTPDGATKDFLQRDGDIVNDIVAGPDGSTWVAGLSQVVRIDAAGNVTRRPLDTNGSASALASAGGTVWIAYDGSPDAGPSIVGVSADGTSRQLKVPATGSFQFNGIAAAADGALWFTARGIREHWIGRMTTDGRYTRWAVPRHVGEPGRIAAGSDGAMWFTGRHAIARISPEGKITSIPLGRVPHDIVTGSDGNLWFSSDICLGRVTSAGAITTWAVPGAVQLEGIAPAADGSFWLADRAGNAVRHFNPAATPPALCGAATLTRAAGPTSATVAFERAQRFDGVDFFTDIRVHVTRNGRERLDAPVPRLRGNLAYSDSHALTVRDLDGDGEAEVMLVLNWAGAHCCSWSRIYRYDRARNTYRVDQRFWGNGGAEPVLRDLDRDRRPELVSLDDRFAERFTNSSGSARPIQIWSYRRGKLSDVTRRYPGAVRRDAARLWRLYLKHRKTNARGILPAWVADQYLLGQGAAADRALAQAAARGELDRDAGFGPPGSEAYIAAVNGLLRDAGYRR